MASGGSDDNLWARTPMGEVLAKASLSQTTPAHAVHLETLTFSLQAASAAGMNEKGRIEELTYQLEADGGIDMPEIREQASFYAFDPDTRDKRRMNRRERIEALREYRGRPFVPPEGGEVLLRCQEGEILVHEDVLCNSSERCMYNHFYTHTALLWAFLEPA